MANPPIWVVNLANNLTACLEPLEPMPPLGCHYHQSVTGWEITVFPSHTEIVGGPQDGTRTVSRFGVDVLAATRLFTRVDDIHWQSKAVHEQDQLGAHLAITGMIDDQIVSVRILKTAPDCFEPGRKALINDGCLIDTW